MALELIITADNLAALKSQVAAWHNQLNGDTGYAGQKAPEDKSYEFSYEIGSGETIPEKPKTAKPKATKADKTEEYKAAVEETAAPLDYAKDVVSKILDKVAALQAAGLTPIEAKTKVQDAIRTTFGVTNAKEVPADKWPALLEAVSKVSTNG